MMEPMMCGRVRVQGSRFPGFRVECGYPFLAYGQPGKGMDKKMETTIVGYIGITVRIHSFIPI